MNSDHWLNIWERESQYERLLSSISSELITYWPKLPQGSRVLVPLCGKSKDMLWLAEQGYQVIGVEISEQLVINFFKENKINYHGSAMSIHQKIYQAKSLPIKVIVGNFFDFQKPPFDALYDKGALMILPKKLRERYVKHCLMLLKPGAAVLSFSMCNHDVVDDVGEAPFSITKEEVMSYWGSELKHVKTVSCPEEGTAYWGDNTNNVHKDVWARQRVGRRA